MGLFDKRIQIIATYADALFRKKTFRLQVLYLCAQGQEEEMTTLFPSKSDLEAEKPSY